jgi:hypothetical protein
MCCSNKELDILRQNFWSYTQPDAEQATLR